MAVVLVLANISDAIMQRHQASSSAPVVLAGCCQDGGCRACVTIEL